MRIKQPVQALGLCTLLALGACASSDSSTTTVNQPATTTFNLLDTQAKDGGNDLPGPCPTGDYSYNMDYNASQQLQGGDVGGRTLTAHVGCGPVQIKNPNYDPRFHIGGEDEIPVVVTEPLRPNTIQQPVQPGDASGSQ